MVLKTILDRFHFCLCQILMFCSSESSYPLVNVYTTMGNHHFQWINQLEMTIFHSYAGCLPGGKCPNYWGFWISSWNICWRLWSPRVGWCETLGHRTPLHVHRIFWSLAVRQPLFVGVSLRFCPACSSGWLQEETSLPGDTIQVSSKKCYDFEACLITNPIKPCCNSTKKGPRWSRKTLFFWWFNSCFSARNLEIPMIFAGEVELDAACDEAVKGWTSWGFHTWYPNNSWMVCNEKHHWSWWWGPPNLWKASCRRW